MVFLTIYCFLSALWAAPSYATIAQLVPEREKAQALATLLVGINLIGSVAGPPLAGLLSDLLTPVAGQEALRYSLRALALMAPLGSIWLWNAASAMREQRIGRRLYGILCVRHAIYTNIEHTVRYLGVDIVDALTLSERTEI
jgi:MFS family permease